MSMTVLSEIKPSQRLRVMDLVKAAGLDVRDWSKFKGGRAKAAVNPKFCYEWSFVGEGVVVLNLWHSLMRENAGAITYQFNLQDRAAGVSHTPSEVIWQRRAKNFERALQLASLNRWPIRVIVCDGVRRNTNDRNSAASRVAKRLLDPVPWAVTEYESRRALWTLARSAKPAPIFDRDDDFELGGFEGASRAAFTVHRKREAGLRKQKIQQTLQANKGRLICEVPNCGFDFAEHYGMLGEGYAHVHHKVPLSEAPVEGRKVTLNDLAVVCANCHAMIHVGGQCRPMDALIPEKT